MSVFFSGSIVREDDHHYFVEVEVDSSAIKPDASAVSAEGNVLNCTITSSELTTEGGSTTYSYEFENINGLVDRFVFSSGGNEVYFPIGLEGEYSEETGETRENLRSDGDEIYIEASSSGREFWVRRIPREFPDEDYPNPTIGNIGANSAALFAFPVNENGGIDRRGQEYIIYLNSVTEGSQAALYVDLAQSPTKILRVRSEGVPASPESIYVLMPAGVIMSGGRIAKYNSTFKAYLNAGGEV